MKRKVIIPLSDSCICFIHSQMTLLLLPQPQQHLQLPARLKLVSGSISCLPPVHMTHYCILVLSSLSHYLTTFSYSYLNSSASLAHWAKNRFWGCKAPIRNGCACHSEDIHENLFSIAQTKSIVRKYSLQDTFTRRTPELNACHSSLRFSFTEIYPR